MTMENLPSYSNWLFGGLGALTNILLSKKEGAPLNFYHAGATLISGSVFAGTGGAAGATLGMGNLSLSLSAFFAGMVGVNVAKRALKRTGDSK